MAADALVEQVLGEKWIPQFEQQHSGNRPVVVVGLVKNKSHEHIDAETFIKDLEKACIRSGSVRLVQAGDKREELRGERADQQNSVLLDNELFVFLAHFAQFVLSMTQPIPSCCCSRQTPDTLRAS